MNKWGLNLISLNMDFRHASQSMTAQARMSDLWYDGHFHGCLWHWSSPRINKFCCPCLRHVYHMGMGQYLLIPFLVGWTSIYQLFWGSHSVPGFWPIPICCQSSWYSWCFGPVRNSSHSWFWSSMAFWGAITTEVCNRWNVCPSAKCQVPCYGWHWMAY